MEDDERGFALGAVDFIHKPISQPILAARIKMQLQMKAWNDSLADQNAYLQKQVEFRLSEINHLQDATIYVMVSLAEFRDELYGQPSASYPGVRPAFGARVGAWLYARIF